MLSLLEGGRGFFGTPEVTDLLNILRALDDPGDTLALVGVLRSPAVVSALPNIYERDQVIEFTGAADVPDVTDEQAARIDNGDAQVINQTIQPGPARARSRAAELARPVRASSSPPEQPAHAPARKP